MESPYTQQWPRTTGKKVRFVEDVVTIIELNDPTFTEIRVTRPLIDVEVPQPSNAERESKSARR